MRNVARFVPACPCWWVGGQARTAGQAAAMHRFRAVRRRDNWDRNPTVKSCPAPDDAAGFRDGRACRSRVRSLAMRRISAFAGSPMPIHPVALVCTAILGLLRASRRVRHALPVHHRFRCAADPANGLHKIVRAHGNTAEYAPFSRCCFLLRYTRSIARDPDADRRGDRVPLPARDRPACLDDGRPESRAFRRRARHVSVRCRAVSRAVRLNGGAGGIRHGP